MNVVDTINSQYSQDVVDALSDKHLMILYINQKSVKNRIAKFRQMNIPEDILTCDEFLKMVIPSGVKGVVRGLRFNKIVKNIIISNFILDNFEIGFELKFNNVSVGDLPDFYVYDKNSDKVIIGYNQVDLFGGGAQSNRADKYIMNNHNIVITKLENIKVKILCVICNHPGNINANTKKYSTFKYGFDNKILCFTNALKDTILDFFKTD